VPRRFLSGVAIAILSGFEALVGTVFGFGLKCDDSCSLASPWRNDPAAWQWTAMGPVALGGFALSLVFLAAVAFRRRIVALAAVVVCVTLGAVFLRLFRDSGFTSHPERGWGTLAAVVIGAMLAVALTPACQRT
jgi:hypothetical protein